MEKIKKHSYFANQIKRFAKHKSIMWFILPAFILTFVLGYIPMLGIILPFFDGETYNELLYGPFEAAKYATWTFKNFANIFSDSSIVRAIGNTLIINFFKIIIIFPFTIFLAVLLSEIKNKFLCRLVLIILCLPHFLSWSVAVGIWTGLMAEINGALNNILVKVGMLDKPFYFFGSEGWFKPLAIFLAGWKGAGWSSILFYAAIMSIDKSYYEAATLDGANKFQKTAYLTLPAILPTIALMFVMNITYIMDAGFEQIMAMMTTSTRYSQQILGTYIYDISIANATDIPFATAVGVFNGLIALVLMLGGNALVKKTLKTSLW